MNDEPTTRDRIRSLDEIKAAIDSLSPDSIVNHVRRHPPFP